MKFYIKSNNNFYRKIYTREKYNIDKLGMLGFEFAPYKESKNFVEITNIPEIELDMDGLIEFSKEYAPVLIDGDTLYIDNDRE